MTIPYSTEQIAGAIDANVRLWKALASDDDDAVLSLLTSGAIEHFGSHPGLAARIRDHLHATTEDCRTMGGFSKIEVLADDRLRLLSVPNATEPREVTAGDTISVWRVELGLDEGRWQADPVRNHDTPTVGWFDIMTGEEGTGPFGSFSR